MKIINIIGDSLSKYRYWQNVSIKDTYAYLLQEKYKDEYYILNNSIRGQSILNINDDLLIQGEADYYIIQLGIVDCFPRLFSKFQKLILNTLSILKLGFISKFIIKILSANSYIVTKFFKKVYVNREMFKKKYEQVILDIKNKNPDAVIIIINIANTGEKTIKMRYNVLNNIIDYNNELYKLKEKYNLEYIDLFFKTKDLLFLNEDEQHINKKGHKFLFTEVSKILNKYEVKKNEKIRLYNRIKS